LFQWFALLSELPVFEQFVFVETEPLKYVSQGASGELTRDDSRFDPYRDLEFAVLRVEVGRNVILVEDRDDNSEESADLRHTERYQKSESFATA
jgi:hypothetical protein